MDKLVRKIEVPLAKEIIKKAGLYIVPENRIGELSLVAADAYLDYPLHNWFFGGKYDETNDMSDAGTAVCGGTVSLGRPGGIL